MASNRETRSPAATAARDAAQQVLSDALADLYAGNLLNNEAIDAEDKTALHIHHTGNGGGRPSPAPETTP